MANPAGLPKGRGSRRSSRFHKMSHVALVRMETTRRATLAITRAKQLWIWTVALALSYLDLVTTVAVGREYLSLRTPEGTRAAYLTFSVSGASLGVQALITHLTGCLPV